MKKKLSGLLLVASTVLGMGALTACNNGGTSSTPAGGDSSVTTPSEAALTEVERKVKDAETLTQDQLFAKAAEELGTTGKLKVAATTSRGGKPTVKNLFIEKLKAHNSGITDPLVYDTKVDGDIYKVFRAEIAAGKKDGYSATITQDGYQLSNAISKGYFVNFVPKEWKEATETDKTTNSDPMTLQYNFKTWMYNNKGMADMVIDNVWDVTHSKYKNKIDTMDPNNENVNMDWLIQLTADEEVAKLKAAYEDSTATTDVDLSKYASYGDKKYAYAFIDAFLTNAVFYADDGAAVKHLAKTPGTIGWIVYSKITSVDESEESSKKDIVIAALGKDNADGGALTASSIKGFGGFMYKHYLQVLKNAQYPYAACAFLSLVSTNATAYSVWAGDVGDYPSMPSINKDRTKGGHGEFVTAEDGTVSFKADVTKPNVLPCLNDPASAWWLSKGGAVVETPSFIGANYDNVIDFIDASIAAKK